MESGSSFVIAAHILIRAGSEAV